MILQIAIYVVMGFIVLGTLATILRIGEPRKVITAKDAVFQVVVSSLYMALLIAILGRL